MVVGKDTRCLGFIVSGKSKICLAPKSCNTKAHEKDLFAFLEGVQNLVFINVGTSAQPSAWVSPFVELSWFGEAWETYKAETRTITSWQTLLEGMSSVQPFSVQDIIRMGEATKTGPQNVHSVQEEKNGSGVGLGF